MNQPEIQMDLSTARGLVKQIKQSVNGAGEQLLRLKRQSGWAVLGYKSWEECAKTEFDFSRSYLFELCRNAEIGERVAPQSDASDSTAPRLNSRQARALSVVDPDKQKEVFEEARRRTGLENPPAAAIEEVIDSLPPKQDDAGPTLPTKRAPAKSKDDQLANEAALKASNIKRIESWFDMGISLSNIPDCRQAIYLAAQKLAAITKPQVIPANVTELNQATA